jgi:hypothetical protein
LKYVGALEKGLAYLSRCNSGGSATDPEEIEGVSELDSEHEDPVLSPYHSSSGSQSSIGNFDDF